VAGGRRPGAESSGIEAYRVELSKSGRSSGEEVVLFVWESEPVSTALTEAEQQVLALLLTGLSNHEIATARGTSSRTVANQVASILRALGARSRYDLISRLGGRVRMTKRTK
jgi:DNA-binding NarL/FixJ family response regulator